MDLSKSYNPYDFANPVSEVSLLVGREREMDEIKYYLDNAMTAPRPISIALLGQRASGKTSILNITELEANSRGFCTVRINLDEDDVSTQLAFFYKLFNSIISEICRNGAFGGIAGKTYDTYLDAVNAYTIPEDKTFCPFAFPIQYAKAMGSGNTKAPISDHNFRGDLLKVHEEIKVPIVLLFDEGNVLAQSRVLLQKLRNVFMNTSGFMLVMTGTPDLFPVMDDVFSPIVRQFKKINVGEFRKVADTHACIIKPLEKLGIEPEKVFDVETYRDVQDIHNLSGGRPYEIQLICHMLFRRVQSKRAEKMKLDFSVLEEVRKELETSQDVATRPILIKVRNLSKKELTGLSILCSCNGHATFEQVWALEYIFNGESYWTKNTLEAALQMHVDKGILKVDNDLISFAGDDFDGIYAKYFAREQRIRLNFSRIPLQVRWNIALNEILDVHLKDRLKPMLESIFIFPSLYTEILNIVHKMESQQPNGDVFVDSEPLSGELYKKMLEYQGKTAIPVIVVNPGLPWLNLQSIYCSIKPTDSEALEEGVDQISSLSERVAKLGGNLAVERSEIPIIPLADLADKVERTANKRLRLMLAAFHMNVAKSAYLQKFALEESLIHANLSYRYNPKPKVEDSNNLGYIFLSADDFDKAEILFERAISLSQSFNSEHPVFPALPIYNLGVLQAECGQLENAHAGFQSSVDLGQNLNSEDRHLMCLWVPVVINGSLVFEERRGPDLLETAESAKAAIERIMAYKSDC